MKFVRCSSSSGRLPFSVIDLAISDSVFMTAASNSDGDSTSLEDIDVHVWAASKFYVLGLLMICE